MKNTIIAIVIAFVLAGCAASKSVITEYNAEGKVVKVTETSESVVKEVTESTKGKTLVVWESGWAAYIVASTATTENPTPTGKMFVGKTDRGAVSALPNQNDWDGIAKAITATKYEISVTKDGVINSSVKTDGAEAKK